MIYLLPDKQLRKILEIEEQRGKIHACGTGYIVHDNYIRPGIPDGIIMPCLLPTRVTPQQNGIRFKKQYSKFYTLTTQDIHGVYTNGRLRCLTPIECERLQGLSYNYTAYVPECYRYKLIGNSFTVQVIEHILSCMEINNV